ncbi:TonB-dependent receptor [Vibrio sp. JC009]|uniref:TonB-dependent receptor domain-containing protein n=1 Tax=Vibrio sp. JC009 TaxID=2912314 RepID=UPI0023AEE7B6|nr:TonB-dependent receptor [Vibrio sp. JC009]WED21735.1 TonB-dependent receptor [Vibrio sp. JC009]
MQKSILAIAVSASLFSYASFSQAQEAASDVETIVVTANRFEQSLESTTVSVEVVTKDEIVAIQAKSITEVLRRLPGIQLSSNGGYGQQQSVFVRGSESDHVLYLIDGIRIGSATTGAASLASIPVFAIECIEYIRGSRAAMYGSDAIAGVINVITKHHRSEVIAGGTMGSDNYKQGQVSLSKLVNEDFHVSFAANSLSTDGFSATNLPGQEDNDGYKSKDFVTTLGYSFNDNLSADIQALYHEGELEYDASGYSYFGGVDDIYQDERSYNIAANIQFENDALTSKLEFGQNQDHLDDNLYSSVYQTDRTSFAFTNQYRVSESWSFGAGVDWYKDDVSESTTAYEETSRKNTAFYINTAANIDSVQLEGALRHDDNERYGQNTTWQLGSGWQFLTRYRLTANAGTGFKAPTFNALYWPNYGNSDLEPEESKSYELALEAEQDLFDWRIAGYITQIDNMISNGENVQEVDIRGIELSAMFDTGPVSHVISFEYMDPEDKENDRQLARRAKENVKWNATYYADNWQADLSYLYQGKRYDYSNGTTELSAYSLVDFAVSYYIFDSLTLRGRVANLLEEDYTLATGTNTDTNPSETYYYNTQERSYYATIEYSF